MEIGTDIDAVAMLARFIKGIASYSSGIFAISALIYLTIKIVVDLKNGATVDPYVWVKPVILILVLASYNFLFTSVNIVFEKRPAELVQEMNTALEKSLKDAEIRANIKTTVPELTGNMVTKGIKKIVVWIMDFLKKAVKIVLEIFQKTSLAILYVIGPFIIALEMVPGLGGSIRAWLIQVITISLWIPIINIVSSVSLVLGKVAADSLVPANANAGASVANSLIFLILSAVIAYLSYSRVPSIAGSLFGSGGVTGAALGQSALGHAHIAGRAAGAKGGKMAMQGLKLSGRALGKAFQSLGGLFKGSEHLKR